MNALRSARTRSRSHQFVPRFEGLEDRWCLSASIQVAQETIRIFGDNAANAVTVFDDGNGTIFAAITDVHGVIKRTARGITNVVINTGAGNDIVNYTLTGPLNTTRNLAVALGAGNDTANLDCLAGVNTGDLYLFADGGDGNDTIKAKLTVNVPGSTGSCSATVLGGWGNDNLTLVAMDAGGPSKGTFKGLLDGGPGVDILHATPNVTIRDNWLLGAL